MSNETVRTKRLFFPFLPLDYKAAEQWLNQRAQQGYELCSISESRIAKFKRADTPRRYAVVLWITSTAQSLRPYEDVEFNKYHEFVTSCGWTYAAQLGNMHIFASPPGETIPLESDPTTEAARANAYGRNRLITGFILLGACILLGLLLMGGDMFSFMALSMNYMLLIMLLVAIMSVILLFRILQLALYNRRLSKAEKEFFWPPVHTVRSAYWRGAIVYGAGVLVVVLMFVCIIADSIISHGSYASVQAAFTTLIPLSVTFTRWTGLFRGRNKWMQLIIPACIMALFLVYALTSMEEKPIKESRLAGQPVFSSATSAAQRESQYNRLTVQRSPLYTYVEYYEDLDETKGVTYSYYVKSCTQALSDRVYNELSDTFRVYYNIEPRMQEIIFPGVDRVQARGDGQGTSILVMQKGLVCVRMDFRLSDVSISDPALQQILVQTFFS